MKGSMVISTATEATVVLATLLILLCCHSALKNYWCYWCNSISDYGCGQDVNRTSSRTQSCEPGSVCSRVIIHTYNDTVGDYYWRGCHSPEITDRLNSCTTGNVTSGAAARRANETSLRRYQTTCLCNRHLCNACSSLRVATALLLIVGAVSATSALRH